MTKSFVGNPHSVGRAKPKTLLKEGNVIELTGEHTVYLVGRSSAIRLTGEYAHLQGEYVVIHTELSGGGQGHGKNDYYPNGHRVECFSKDTKHKVYFYQTGSFTAMIEDIKPIGNVNIKIQFEDM